MANIQKDILFDHFISGMEKEMQAVCFLIKRSRSGRFAFPAPFLLSDR